MTTQSHPSPAPTTTPLIHKNWNSANTSHNDRNRNSANTDHDTHDTGSVRDNTYTIPTPPKPRRGLS